MTRTSEHPPQVESPVPIGTVVDGYRIRRIIAVRAGLHTLAEATDPSGEPVTLKLLAKPPAGKDVRRRAAKLSSVRASIQHPNMLPLIPNGDGKQRLCLKSAPAGAVTLAERLQDGPLTPKQSVAVTSQVAGALETAGQRGLTHRELTPAAIIVTAEDPPKALLTDFGLVRPDAPGCELPAAVEDADYRSPEEIRGEPPTAASNVYSLACILTACLTGSPPYPYDRPLLALHAHSVEPPPRLSERNPHLPGELDAAVARAMAKDPARRHRSPGALIRDVQRAIGVEARIPVTGGSERPAAQDAPAPAPVPQPAAPAVAASTATEPSPPKTTRRERRRARRDRPRATSRFIGARRLAPTWIGVALVASALAGFATGNGRTDGSEEPSPAPSVAQPAASEAVSAKPTVGPVMARLDERRTAARDRLQAAKLPGEQAAIATRIAAIYGDARAALLKQQDASGARQRLAAQLQTVEAAYRDLAQAAKQGNAGAWRRASSDVRDRERDFELLLRTRRWT